MDSNKKDNENIFSSSGSIFEEAQSLNVPAPGYGTQETNPEIGKTSFVTNFLNMLSEELTNFQVKKQGEKLQKLATELFKDNEEILGILKKHDCRFVYKKEYIELQCLKFSLCGKIYFEEDGTLTFDDATKAIIYKLSEIVRHSNNVNNILDKNEEEGFYPIGKLTKQKIMFKGREREVLTGTLANNKGETRQIYYYRGKEIVPDE